VNYQHELAKYIYTNYEGANDAAAGGNFLIMCTARMLEFRVVEWLSTISPIMDALTMRQLQELIQLAKKAGALRCAQFFEWYSEHFSEDILMRSPKKENMKTGEVEVEALGVPGHIFQHQALHYEAAQPKDDGMNGLKTTDAIDAELGSASRMAFDNDDFTNGEEDTDFNGNEQYSGSISDGSSSGCSDGNVFDLIRAFKCQENPRYDIKADSVCRNKKQKFS